MAFLHGIRLAFLRPVGACFGLLPQQEDDNLAANDDLQPLQNGHEDEGSLPPAKTGEASAANDGLQQHQKGCLLPVSGEDDAEYSDLHKHDDGELLPTSGVQHHAVNTDLQPVKFGHKESLGTFPLMKEEEEEAKTDACKASSEPFEESSNEDKKNLLLQPHGWLDKMGIHLPQNGEDGMNVPFPPMQIGGHDHAKPRVDPKVKKKTSLLLCLTIQTPFHPGEYGHDGSPSPQYPHHDPYSIILSFGFTPQAILVAAYTITMITHHINHHIGCAAVDLHNSTSLSINNTSSFLDLAENVDNTSLSLPLHILRGSVHEQDDVMQDEVNIYGAAAFKTKTKRRKMMMRLFYLSKDVLDPG